MEQDRYFLPSEVARLVLGYLKENNYTLTYKSFLKECPHLQEYTFMLKQGHHFPLSIMGVSLQTMVQEYAELKLKASRDGQWTMPLAALWKEFETVVKALKQATKMRANLIGGELQKSRSRRNILKNRYIVNQQTQSEKVKTTSPIHSSSSFVPSPAQLDTVILNKSVPKQNVSSYSLRSKKSISGKIDNKCKKLHAETVCDEDSITDAAEQEDCFDVLVERECQDYSLNKDDDKNSSDMCDAGEDEHQEVIEKDVSDTAADTDCNNAEKSEYFRSENSASYTHRKEMELRTDFTTKATSQCNTSAEFPVSSINLYSSSTSCFGSFTTTSDNLRTPQKNQPFHQDNYDNDSQHHLIKSPRRKRNPPKKWKDSVNTSKSTVTDSNVQNKEENHVSETPHTTFGVPELFEKILNDTKLHEKLAETINERFLEVKSTHHTSINCSEAKSKRKESDSGELNINEDTMDRILNKPLTSSEENIIDGIIQITTSDPIFDTLFKTFDAVDSGNLRLSGENTNNEVFSSVISAPTSVLSPCSISCDSQMSSGSQSQTARSKPRRIKPTPIATGFGIESSQSPWSLRPVASPAFAQACEQIVSPQGLGHSSTVQSSWHTASASVNNNSVTSSTVTCHRSIMAAQTDNSVPNSSQQTVGQTCHITHSSTENDKSLASYQIGSDGQITRLYTLGSGSNLQTSPASSACNVNTSEQNHISANELNSVRCDLRENNSKNISGGISSYQDGGDINSQYISIAEENQTNNNVGVSESVPQIMHRKTSPYNDNGVININSQCNSVSSENVNNNNTVISKSPSEFNNAPNKTSPYNNSIGRNSINGTLNQNYQSDNNSVVTKFTSETENAAEGFLPSLFDSCSMDVFYQPVGTTSVSYGPSSTVLNSPANPSNSFLNHSILPREFSPSMSDTLQTVTCLPGSILSDNLKDQCTDSNEVREVTPEKKTQTKKSKKQVKKPKLMKKANPQSKRTRYNKKTSKSKQEVLPVASSTPRSQNKNLSVQNKSECNGTFPGDSGDAVISVPTPQKDGDNSLTGFSQLLTLSPGGNNWLLTDSLNISTDGNAHGKDSSTKSSVDLNQFSMIRPSPKLNHSVLVSSVIDSQSGSAFLKITSPTNSNFKWPNILSRSGKKTPQQIETLSNDGYFENPKDQRSNSGSQETFIAVPICKKSDLVNKDTHVRSLGFACTLPNKKTALNKGPNSRHFSTRLDRVCIRELDCGGEAVASSTNTFVLDKLMENKSKPNNVTMIKTTHAKTVARGHQILELNVTSPDGKKSTVMSLIDKTENEAKLLQSKNNKTPAKTTTEKKDVVKSLPLKLPIPPLSRPLRQLRSIRPKPPASSSQSIIMKHSKSISNEAIKKELTPSQAKYQNMSPAITVFSEKSSEHANEEEEAAWTLASFSSNNILADAMREANISAEDAASQSGFEERTLGKNSCHVSTSGYSSLTAVSKSLSPFVSIERSPDIAAMSQNAVDTVISFSSDVSSNKTSLNKKKLSEKAVSKLLTSVSKTKENSHTVFETSSSLVGSLNAKTSEIVLPKPLVTETNVKEISSNISVTESSRLVNENISKTTVSSACKEKDDVSYCSSNTVNFQSVNPDCRTAETPVTRASSKCESLLVNDKSETDTTKLSLNKAQKINSERNSKKSSDIPTESESAIPNEQKGPKFYKLQMSSCSNSNINNNSEIIVSELESKNRPEMVEKTGSPKLGSPEGQTKEHSSITRLKRKSHFVDFSADETSMESNSSCSKKKKKGNIKTLSVEKLLSLLHKS